MLGLGSLGQLNKCWGDDSEESPEEEYHNKSSPTHLLWRAFGERNFAAFGGEYERVLNAKSLGQKVVCFWVGEVKKGEKRNLETLAGHVSLSLLSIKFESSVFIRIFYMIYAENLNYFI